LASAACELTHWREPHVLGTLAAAYAAAAEFVEAVKRQLQALEWWADAKSAQDQQAPLSQ
jgi:hypothetical protein